jgi:hypothetical protein
MEGRFSEKEPAPEKSRLRRPGDPANEQAGVERLAALSLLAPGPR